MTDSCSADTTRARGRDAPPFDFAGWRSGPLEALVLRPLSERLGRGESVRAWVPAGGDGVAAYALALSLLRAAAPLNDAPSLRVFATEPDRDRLAAARAGRLSRDQVRPFLRAGFRRSFTWTGEQWRVKPSVRGRLICSVHDPLRSNSFAQVDLVYALNAFAATPAACITCLVRQLVNALTPGGLLVAPPGLHLDHEIATLRALDLGYGVFRLAAAGAPPAWRRRRLAPAPSSAALLERVAAHLAPKGVVVAESGAIIGTVGDARQTLLTCMAPHPPSLGTAPALDLRASLLDAFVGSLRRHAPAVSRIDGQHDIAVSATPLTPSPLSADPVWLLQMIPAGAGATMPADTASLRAHLVSTTETLRQAMEEVATRNLTLKTANDELQTSIEDLERSNRQFAAMNTELTAVRQEHEHRIDELNALNLDVENLFQAADLAVVVLDEAGRLRRYTPAAGRLFKLARTDIGNAFASLLAGGLESLGRAVHEVQSGGRQRQLSLEIPRDDGGRLAGLARVHPYRGDGDRLTGTIVTLTDVSELKAAQDNLQERNLALTRANEDLERFAYIASHDLKSPLRSVRTMLEFLRSDLGEALADDNRQHLELVADRVQQMEQMIQDLLTYSRLGREARPPEPVDLGELIREQVDMLDIPPDVAVTIETDMPTLNIDVGLFEHVVRNLVDNAVKHHDRSRGSVRIAMVPGAQVPTFEVADDGPGIPARYRERVFEIFQKGGGRSDAGGSGMGLALVKKAVERNGGEIRIVDTGRERGTTFRFTWPERPAAQPADHRS